MKKISLTLILVAVFSGIKAQSDTETLWDMANTAYINSDYDKAILYYDSIQMSGLDGYKLYYNLGNSHFKKGNIGLSVLNYNRALRLAPSQNDVKYNLMLANARVKDQIKEVPRFFLVDFKSLQRSVGEDAWAIISLVLFALVLGSLLLYLLSETVALRKTGFYIALLGALFFAFAFISGIAERRDILSSDDAVITSSSVAIKSSPDASSKDIFVLHEGTVVGILETLNGWTEILIADGNKGWVQTSSIETI